MLKITLNKIKMEKLDRLHEKVFKEADSPHISDLVKDIQNFNRQGQKYGVEINLSTYDKDVMIGISGQGFQTVETVKKRADFIVTAITEATKFKQRAKKVGLLK